MINGFKVITLCGSTRFKDEFLEAQKRLTLEGNVVISVGLFGHSGDDEVWTEGVKDMLDRQHLAKIDLADEIFVINVGGYIGESTRREIAYAEFKGKSISYLESCKKPGIYDNYDAMGELYDACKYMSLLAYNLQNQNSFATVLGGLRWVCRICDSLSQQVEKESRRLFGIYQESPYLCSR